MATQGQQVASAAGGRVVVQVQDRFGVKSWSGRIEDVAAAGVVVDGAVAGASAHRVGHGEGAWGPHR